MSLNVYTVTSQRAVTRSGKTSAVSRQADLGTEDVPEGLRTSQVLLALLSPQSVRRALDVGNPTATDSVCLDEIAYARGSHKIPIVPVQVVSCEAPFLIYRLHQIDFRRWAESEATYQAGLNLTSFSFRKILLVRGCAA
jgi:hypothetical protein